MAQMLLPLKPIPIKERLSVLYKEIRYSTVDMAGELEVADSGNFRRMLLNGVGRARAFGCGLLLVRRIG